MKASKLISELEKRIAKDGDHEVGYYAQDDIDGTLNLTPDVSVWGMHKEDTTEVDTYALCNQDQHDFQVENQDVTSVGDD